MPLPTPSGEESRDDFVGRCVGDEKMLAEFPDDDQRAAVCGNIYDKPNEMEAAAFSILRGQFPAHNLVAQFRQARTDTYSWDAEVFAVGTWNGFKFTEADLDEIVRSFEALHGGGYLDAPLKFGHNDEQPLTDGAPALGWIDKLYTKQDDKGRTKLMATFADVPKVVYDLVKTKRYKKVSIELDFDVTHKGNKYKYVLTGAALLGAALPAVNTLADLTAYMGRDTLAAARHATFSAINGNIQSEETNMAIEIDEKELADLRAKAARADDAEKKAQDFARKEQQAKVDAARTTANAALDKAVKDMRINPAQRAAFAKVLKVDDDAAVLTLTVADIEAMLPAAQAGAATFSRDGDNGASTESAAGDDTDDFLTTEANKIVAANGGKMGFTRALELAMQAHPDAARKHLGLTG